MLELVGIQVSNTTLEATRNRDAKQHSKQNTVGQHNLPLSKTEWRSKATSKQNRTGTPTLGTVIVFFLSLSRLFTICLARCKSLWPRPVVNCDPFTISAECVVVHVEVWIWESASVAKRACVRGLFGGTSVARICRKCCRPSLQAARAETMVDGLPRACKCPKTNVNRSATPSGTPQSC